MSRSAMRWSGRFSLVACLLVWMVVAGMPAVVMAEETQFIYTYQVIRQFGPVEEMRSKLRENEELREASDGENAYILRKMTVTSESDLLRAMGQSNEGALSDRQRGLLETFRFAQSQTMQNFHQYHPRELRSIELQLVDTNGFEDEGRYPSTKNDFWPNNTRYMRTGATPSTRSVIQVSGVDSIGYGSETAAEMKATYAHEYGHSLDRTRTENDGYGPDGTHFWNEVIAAKSAFAEGFAVFFEVLLFPKRNQQVRDAQQWVRYEKDAGGYVTQNPLSEHVKGKDLLRVEGVNAMLLYRLSKEIGDGFSKVLGTFSQSNSAENTMVNFLKTYAARYPADTAKMAEILDEQTHKKLSDAEFREILGSGAGVELFLRRRRGNSVPVTVEPAQPTPTPTSPSGRRPMYKWTDSSGGVHFSDSPPPAGVKYELRAPARVNVENTGSNPFFDE